jgi:hypothetical protein
MPNNDLIFLSSTLFHKLVSDIKFKAIVCSSALILDEFDLAIFSPDID